MPFFSRIVVNRNDPNRLAIATNYAYTTTDAQLLDDAAPLTNLGAIVGTTGKFSSATALAYGTQDDVDALLVGSTFTTGTPDNPVGNNWLLLANHTTPLTRLANYGGDAPTSVVFDDRHAARYYVADGTKLWTNVDATTNTTFTDLSENLDVPQPHAADRGRVHLPQWRQCVAGGRPVDRRRVGEPARRRRQPDARSAGELAPLRQRHSQHHHRPAGLQPSVRRPGGRHLRARRLSAV